MSDEREPFLKRWSRLKQESEQATAKQPEADDAPQLPPVESLDFNSDYSGFMHSKVDPDLRRKALKKLFASPHYQAMDGLDVYVGDYSNPEPLTPALLASLVHAQSLLADDKKPAPLGHSGGAAQAPDSATAAHDTNAAPGQRADNDTEQS